MIWRKFAVLSQNTVKTGFGFSAKNLAENPKKMAGFEPQDPQLFGCMAARHAIAGRVNF